MSEFKDIYNKEKKKIEAIIEQEISAVKDKIYPSLYEAMHYSLFTGGKRVRPVIVGWFASLGDSDSRTLSKTASAIEFVHTYSLIHDDLPSMDDDDTRRGKPTTHIKFSEAEAILAGDALLTEAFRMLAESGKVRLVKILSEACGAMGMVGGQAADIDRSSARRNIDYINNLKTAELFRAASVMGAVAGNLKEKEIKKASIYGINLGRAFQLRDDLIDDESDDIKTTRKKAAEFVDKAKKAIIQFKNNDKLIKLAEYVVEREK